MTIGPRGRPLTPEAWDREYREGKWEYLDTPGEAGRYGVIAAYTHHFAAGGRVLDLGCGEALLFRHLEGFVGGYVGLEASAVAVERARVPPGRGRVLCADVSAQDLSELGGFEVAIANEVLYHLLDPLELIHRLRRHLEPGGVLIVSMFEPSPESRWQPIVAGIWQALDTAAGPSLAGSRVVDLSSHLAWNVRVFGAEA